MSLHGFHFEVKATRDEFGSKYFFFLQVSVTRSLYEGEGEVNGKQRQTILLGPDSFTCVVNSGNRVMGGGMSFTGEQKRKNGNWASHDSLYWGK